MMLTRNWLFSALVGTQMRFTSLTASPLTSAHCCAPENVNFHIYGKGMQVNYFRIRIVSESNC